ncbi:MAG: hypothetical protein A2X12_09840 [Bacteroidetes bacterium GWE2_29_8]|nr:MAG: hypothetical protein A2X12_09840 [Bacteroidetes bacterium GWE2_29_8]
MKAVFISYNQSLTENVQEILNKMGIRGYTQWTDIQGRGSLKGEPHEGTHTWPELNNTHLVIVEVEKVPALLESLKLLDEKSEQQGLRAFVWNVENSI